MSKQFENMQKLAFGKVLINESIDTIKMTKSALKEKIREMILAEIHQIDDPQEEFGEKVGQNLEDRKNRGEITDEQFHNALEYLGTDSNEYDLFHEFGRKDAVGAADAILKMSLDEAKKKKKSKPENVAPQEDIDIDIAAEPAAEAPAEPSMDAAPAESTNSGNVVRDIQNLLQDAFEKAQQLPDNEDKEKTINQISNTIKMFINTQVLGSGQQPGIAEDLNESEEYNTGEKYSYRGKVYDIWVDDEHNRYIKVGGSKIDI